MTVFVVKQALIGKADSTTVYTTQTDEDANAGVESVVRAIAKSMATRWKNMFVLYNEVNEVGWFYCEPKKRHLLTCWRTRSSEGARHSKFAFQSSFCRVASYESNTSRSRDRNLHE